MDSVVGEPADAAKGKNLRGIGSLSPVTGIKQAESVERT
jgi:hypothetical protein